VQEFDWLNEITDERFRLFGLEVELWKICDSSAAPNFNIVSKPNEWTRSITQVCCRIENDTLSETKKLQFDFWITLQGALEGHQFLRSRRPRPQHWTTFSIGRAELHLAGTLDTRKNRLGVELYLGDENAKAYFSQLKEDQSAIESELAFQPEWLELSMRRACRIITYL